ncbi:MAG: plasmid maintenance system killer [Ignavibacteria bacterium CG_4_8_14_3_um_filter_37_9]|nr:MAG: plasmid maintenance system killer [Ignavibacteria bacterium CG_4_8_14_3_um_filter_37_9]
MIKSFSNRLTEELFNRQIVKKIPSTIIKSAYRKLLILDAAERLDDLKIPPGNRLEKLSGGLSGKYSIRINDQWRITFRWKENNAYEVEIIDYHKG